MRACVRARQEKERKWISQFFIGTIRRCPASSMEIFLVLVTSSSLPSLCSICLWCTNLSTCQFVFVFICLNELVCFMLKRKKKWLKLCPPEYDHQKFLEAAEALDRM